jgi:hypothetical protein
VGPNALVRAGSENLVVYRVYADRPFESDDIRAVLLGEGGARWTRTLLERDAWLANAVWDGAAFRVTAIRGECPLTVVGLAVDLEGALLPGASFELPEPALGSGFFVRESTPVAAAAPDVTLMAWHDGLGQVKGLRFAPGGPPLDGAPFEIARRAAAVDTVRAAWDGARFVVIWRERQRRLGERPLNNAQLHGRYLDRGGTPLGEVFTIAQQVTWEDAPGLACLATGACLVAYATVEPSPAILREVHLVHLSAPLPAPDGGAGAGVGGAGGGGCHCRYGSRAPAAPLAAVAALALALLGRRRAASANPIIRPKRTSAGAGRGVAA